MGLRATASYDYTVDDVFVSDDASFAYAAPGSIAPEHRRGGAVYDLGVLILTCVGHAGWAMGITRRRARRAAHARAHEAAHGRVRRAGRERAVPP